MGFTSFGGAGGPGFSPTAFTTTFTDSAYTATPGERVISNGATVTMPSSPTAGDVVLVGRVGSSSVSIQPNGNELIETADVGYIEQDSTVALISDGSDWYAVDGSEFVSAIPDSGVHRWEFEQDLTDSWESNDGTDNSSAGYSTNSAVGTYAKSFDGDDTVEISQPDISMSSDWSMGLWVYVDGLSSDQDVWGHFDGSTDLWFIRVNPDGTVEFSFGESGGNFAEVTTTGTVSEATYIHLAATWDASTDTLTAYIDGSNDSNVSSAADDPFDGGTVTFGARSDGSRYVTGELDDPRVYDKTLSDSEVSNWYSTGSIDG